MSIASAAPVLVTVSLVSVAVPCDVTVPVFAAVLRVPFAAIAPMIVVSCAIGAYAIQNAMFDIWLMLVFGLVGYVFKKIGIPLAPFTLDHAAQRLTTRRATEPLARAPLREQRKDPRQRTKRRERVGHVEELNERRSGVAKIDDGIGRPEPHRNKTPLREP